MHTRAIFKTSQPTATEHFIFNNPTINVSKVDYNQLYG